MKNVVLGFGLGFVGFVILLITIFIGGETFGQRCTAMGKTGEAWYTCVHDLANGK